MTSSDRFETLYRAHEATVRRCVVSLGLPPHLGPDLLQDVWLTALRRLDELAAHPQQAAWLCAVARNHARHLVRGYLRRRTKHRALASEPHVDVDEPFRECDAWEALHRLLADCPLEQREVYLRIELYGMTPGEVAGELGVSVNTVHSRLRLSRQRLRASASALAALLLLLRGRLAMGALFAGTRAPAPWGQFAASMASPSAPMSVILIGLVVGLMMVIPGATSGAGEDRGSREERPGRIDLNDEVASVHTSVWRQAWAEPQAPALGPARAPLVDDGPMRATHRAMRSPGRVSPGPRDPSTQAGAPRKLTPEDDDLLCVARQDFRVGRFQRALVAALKHRERYPSSKFRNAREMLIIRAVCHLGRSAEAREAVRAFARESPHDSVFRAHLRELPPRCR